MALSDSTQADRPNSAVCCMVCLSGFVKQCSLNVDSLMDFISAHVLAEGSNLPPPGLAQMSSEAAVWRTTLISVRAAPRAAAGALRQEQTSSTVPHPQHSVAGGRMWSCVHSSGLSSCEAQMVPGLHCTPKDAGAFSGSSSRLSWKWTASVHHLGGWGSVSAMPKHAYASSPVPVRPVAAYNVEWTSKSSFHEEIMFTILFQSLLSKLNRIGKIPSSM